MERQILSISQISQYIHTVFDQDRMLSNVAVRGEISNYKVYPSGHHYFTLKDPDSSLKCVMFRSNAMRVKFQPENGMKIIAVGKIGVYQRDGAYQLYCNTITLDGIGDLHTAFEQLKTKLAAQGLFDVSHKKKLPQYPGTIGIITSSAGAAIHDMLRILRKRYPLTNVKLLPVRVQGIEAPAEIVSAINFANEHKLVDLLIVGRGGGSIEDLWAFNDERVAYAIYNSSIPVISAVGHEPDVTISDYVADLRAATPSNAAELAVPDIDVLKQTLDVLLGSMENSIKRDMKSAMQSYRTLRANLLLHEPIRYIQQKRNALSLQANLLVSNYELVLNQKRHKFAALTAKLDALSPLKVLSRGYAMITGNENNVIRSVKLVSKDDIVNIQLSDGTMSATIRDVKESSYEH